MTQYEIKTDVFEFRFTKGRPIPSMSAAEVFDTYMSCDPRVTANFLDSKTVETYETAEEARAAFDECYADYGTICKKTSFAGIPLLVGELAYLEEGEYDDDGEFIQGGDVLMFSAAPYSEES